jgi:probable HAF family extracellular repeat protein
VGADAKSYTIEDLGTIDGFVPTVTGINASGDVSGYVVNSAGPRAVHFVGGAWAYVPGLESLMSDAQAINAYGDMTGYVVTAAGNLRAYRYTASTNTVGLIEPMGTGSYTAGIDINDSGEVAGYGDTGDPSEGTRSFRASVGLPAQKLPSLNGSFSIAFGINNAGDIVGAADTATFVQHGFRAKVDGTILGFAGLNGSDTSTALAVDSGGQIVGQASIDADGAIQHAFKCINGTLTDLDAFGSSFSSAEGIAEGTTVGSYTAADGSSRAFSHTDADGSIDLNTRIPAGSGWTLTMAHAVGKSGQIVGEGMLNGSLRAFRLTPVLPPPPPPPPPPPSDTTAPTILSIGATPQNIWPANGQWVKVTLSVKASDDSGVAPACQLTKISADEGAADDAKIVDASTGQVRALRNRHQDQRVYTFQVTCGDQAGNQSQGEVNVTVAKNRDLGFAAIKRAALQHKCVLAFAKYHKGKGKGRR